MSARGGRVTAHAMRCLVAGLLGMTVTGCGPQGDPTRLRGGEVLLQLVAKGEVETRPDEATVTVAVESTGATAEAALQANSSTMTRVLGAVEAAGVAARDTRTNDLSVNRGRYNRTAKRFESRNAVELTIRDLAKVGAVVAAANDAGANDITGPSFAFTDSAKPRQAARMVALAEAKREADAYAGALGKRVLRVVRVSETGEASPAYAMAGIMDTAMTAPPPVRSGTQTSVVSTRVDFVLGPR